MTIHNTYKEYLQDSIKQMKKSLESTPKTIDEYIILSNHIVYCEAVLDDKYIRPFERKRILNALISQDDYDGIMDSQ